MISEVIHSLCCYIAYINTSYYYYWFQNNIIWSNHYDEWKHKKITCRWTIKHFMYSFLRQSRFLFSRAWARI